MEFSPSRVGPGDRNRRGRAAEDLACAYLELRGFRVLERDYRAGTSQVDLVMQDQLDVVFVEVKLRGEGARARSAESLGGAQQRRLRRAAAAWLSGRGETCIRFDAVLVEDSGEGVRLRHLRGAF